MIANFGDSFIMFMEWDADGSVQSWSAQPYGTAVTDESSPHYNDQSQMFVDRELKSTGWEN